MKKLTLLLFFVAFMCGIFRSAAQEPILIKGLWAIDGDDIVEFQTQQMDDGDLYMLYRYDTEHVLYVVVNHTEPKSDLSIDVWNGNYKIGRLKQNIPYLFEFVTQHE